MHSRDAYKTGLAWANGQYRHLSCICSSAQYCPRVPTFLSTAKGIILFIMWQEQCLP